MYSKMMSSSVSETSVVCDERDESLRSGKRLNLRLIRNLAVAQVIFGVLSFFIGMATFIKFAFVENHGWNFPVSLFGFGMWCGLVFLASGVIGIFTARRNTSCLIVAHLILCSFGIIFALTQSGFGIAAAAYDRVYIENSSAVLPEGYHRNYYGYYDYVYRNYSYVRPIPMLVLNAMLSVVGLVMVGLLCTSSGLLCASTCCQTKNGTKRAMSVTGCWYSKDKSGTRFSCNFCSTSPQEYDDTQQYQPLPFQPIRSSVYSITDEKGMAKSPLTWTPQCQEDSGSFHTADASA